MATNAQKVQLLPHVDYEAEQSVLGAVLLKSATMEPIRDLLLPEDFKAEHHRTIYKALLSLYEAGKPIDLVTVTSYLKDHGALDAVGGAIFLAGLSEHVGTSANAAHYAQMVYDLGTKRRLFEACRDVTKQCLDTTKETKVLLDEAEKRVFSITRSYLSGKFRTLEQGMKDEVDRLGSLQEKVKGGKLSGVPTGFADLNSITFGWQPGNSIILAGRPGHGKTALALNLGRASAMAGEPCAFFSLEMTEGQLVQRLLSAHGHISGDSMRSGNIQAEEWHSIYDAMNDMMELPLWIMAGQFNIMDIKSSCRRLRAQEGKLSLVIIDYLGLIKPIRAGRSRYEEVSEISRAIKNMASEFNCPVIALQQLNRKLEERKDRRPIMSDLRDSGEIEQDADVIMFVYRDELYDENSKDKGLTEILIRKHRSGKTGNLKLNFHDDQSRFSSYTPEEEAF